MIRESVPLRTELDYVRPAASITDSNRRITRRPRSGYSRHSFATTLEIGQVLSARLFGKSRNLPADRSPTDREKDSRLRPSLRRGITRRPTLIASSAHSFVGRRRHRSTGDKTKGTGFACAVNFWHEPPLEERRASAHLGEENPEIRPLRNGRILQSW